jgi:hypothetical protein
MEYWEGCVRLALPPARTGYGPATGFGVHVERHEGDRACEVAASSVAFERRGAPQWELFTSASSERCGEVR